MKNKKRKIQSIIILILLFILCIIATAGITVLYVNKTNEDKIKESTTTTIEIITTKAMPRATQLNKTTIPANKQSLQLEKIEVEGRDIEFSPTKYYYDIDIPYNVTKLNIKTKTINENTRTFTSGNEELQVGLNTITIQTYNEDGEFAFYKLFVYRANQNGELEIQTQTNITSTSTTTTTTKTTTTKKTTTKQITTKKTTKKTTNNKNVNEIIRNTLIQTGFVEEEKDQYIKIMKNNSKTYSYYFYNNSTKVYTYYYEDKETKTDYLIHYKILDGTTELYFYYGNNESYAELTPSDKYTCEGWELGCETADFKSELIYFKKVAKSFIEATGLTEKEIYNS